jgi:hypothetical protein
MRISRRQLPITPAYAITDSCAQGKTLDKVIVDLTLPPNRRLASPASNYVALSRVTSLDGLLILRPWSEQDVAVPVNSDLKEEIERLSILEKKTIDKFRHTHFSSMISNSNH